MPIAVKPLTPERFGDLEAMFDDAGFAEVACHKPARLIVRLTLRCA